jgi:hypothetical protein
MRRYGVIFLIWFFSFPLYGENIRALIAGTVEISDQNPQGGSFAMSIIDTALVLLGEEIRFLRGIELELTAPQSYLQYRGSLAIVLYGELQGAVPEPGVADISVRQFFIEPLPNKIQTVYQIPVRQNHGLRTSPYAAVPTGVIRPEQFPLLVRLMPVIKGYSEEFEQLHFQFSARPIFSDEGAVRITVNYPAQLPDRPFTLLIDDTVIENSAGERLLKEGEHHLVIVSEDYRNENRRFIVERGKVLELSITLQDPAPVVSFEAPANTRVFFDNVQVHNFRTPMPAVPGEHHIRFQIGDYSLLKALVVEKGKTYRITLDIDMRVSEIE